MTERVDVTDQAADEEQAPDRAEEAAGRQSARRRGGLAAAVGEDFDLSRAVGGKRGVVESVAPGAIFLVVYIATKDVVVSSVAPVAAAVLALAARLVGRLDVTPAVSGLLGVGVSAFWALRTGQASNYFTVGLLLNAGYLAALALSLAVRWPLMGLVLGFLRGDATRWRRADDEDGLATRRAYTRLTWLWAGVFALRLLVQTPLYLTDATTALAVSKLVMGLPLFALAAWATWMTVRALPPAAESSAAGPGQGPAGADERG
ncbi:hypothetical protein HMPREF0972_02062 [Actinomyces sp. oral taxon 848 str. F0332]|uniref:Potassium ABC transporter n=1 Tax=Peptidiphaga gingivicola TaxID=2741497 RepID=A0A179B0H3_9ACTO|nr:DUF3159 domain-containing protein [Peptidiphaga gingivicola]EEZ77539.1 hypothetical protein HMPREF0972_02062 [Actinomyces sp. oral taxon 848 str. F0332]OAP85192.1 hypothetical protein A4H34_08755 [Peptidiphaga gingivicola]